MNKYYWVWAMCSVISICSTTGAILSMIYGDSQHTIEFMTGGLILIAFIVFWVGVIEASS